MGRPEWLWLLKIIEKRCEDQLNIVKVLYMIFNVNEDVFHHIRQRDLLQQWLHNQNHG